MHDFDPGITPYPEGLFWTVPLSPPDGVDVQYASGKARMHATNLALLDFFDIPNALFRFEDPVQTDAICTFDIHWSPPVSDRSQVNSPSGSVGELVQCTADITWSASNDLGFSYVSDPEGTTSVFGQLGKVRNGVFA